MAAAAGVAAARCLVTAARSLAAARRLAAAASPGYDSVMAEFYAVEQTGTGIPGHGTDANEHCHDGQLMLWECDKEIDQ